MVKKQNKTTQNHSSVQSLCRTSRNYLQKELIRNINVKLNISADPPLFYFTVTTSWTQNMRFSLFRINNCSDCTLLLIIFSSLFSVKWDHPIHTDMLMTHFNTWRKKSSNESIAQRDFGSGSEPQQCSYEHNFGGGKTLLINIWLMTGMFFSFISFLQVYKAVRAKVRTVEFYQ